MRRGKWTIFLGSALFWVPEPATAETLERDFYETFAVAPGARLELTHGDGDVFLRPWAREAIDVKVQYRAEFRSLGLTTEPGFDVAFERRGETLVVRGRETGGKGIGFFSGRRRDYTYTIQAPAWVVLDIRGDDGDVEIEGWRADMRSVLEDGDVDLADFRGNAVIATEDGDIDIEGFEGALQIRVEDGDVDIRDCSSEDLEVRAEDGDVSIEHCSGSFGLEVEDGGILVANAVVSTLEIRSSDGDVDVELVSASDLDLEIEADDGDVTLELGAEVSATYTIETDDGIIHVAAGGETRSRSGHRVSGQIGDGSGSIRVTTADGNVTLR